MKRLAVLAVGALFLHACANDSTTPHTTVARRERISTTPAARAWGAVERALGQKPQVKLWRFATDGRISAAKGITTIGFSPCEEHLTHTTDDHVKISMMLDSLKAYPLILR